VLRNAEGLLDVRAAPKGKAVYPAVAHSFVVDARSIKSRSSRVEMLNFSMNTNIFKLYYSTIYFGSFKYEKCFKPSS
jgi:hypothetical protein